MVRLAADRETAHWQPRWDQDAAAAALAEADPRLRPALDAPLPLRPNRAPFAHLVRAICAQQVSTAAADAIERRLRAACGGSCTPEAIRGTGTEVLRAAGLSAAKVRSLGAIAAAASDGLLDDVALADLDDAAVIARLDALPGIGRWTADMFLLFALHRPDVLPIGDLGVRAAAALLLQDPPPQGGVQEPLSPKALAAAGARWVPHRSAATLALWAWRRVTTAGGPAE